MNEQIYWIIFSIPSIFIASTVHEYAHAWAAFKLGDYTAKMNGRMTLNPLAHIDPIGAIMMVIARFGWSKPVPVNEYNFQNPVQGTAITSLAGPISNLILALLTAIPIRLFLSTSATLSIDSFSSNYILMFLLTFMMVNISLAIFNLIPIPPLDGHKVIRAIIPESMRPFWEGLQRYGIWILVLLFFPISPLYGVTVGFLSFMVDSIFSILLGAG